MSDAPSPMSGQPSHAAEFERILRDTQSELRELAKDYVKLTKLKLKANGNVAKQAFACVVAACLFGAIGIAELIYGIVGLLVAKTPEIQDQSLVVLISAGVCLTLSVVSGFGAAGVIKKIYPLASMLTPLPASGHGAVPLRNTIIHN